MRLGHSELYAPLPKQIQNPIRAAQELGLFAKRILFCHDMHERYARVFRRDIRRGNEFV